MSLNLTLRFFQLLVTSRSDFGIQHLPGLSSWPQHSFYGWKLNGLLICGPFWKKQKKKKPNSEGVSSLQHHTRGRHLSFCFKHLHSHWLICIALTFPELKGTYVLTRNNKKMNHTRFTRFTRLLFWKMSMPLFTWTSKICIGTEKHNNNNIIIIKTFNFFELFLFFVIFIMTCLFCISFSAVYYSDLHHLCIRDAHAFSVKSMKYSKIEVVLKMA